MSIKLIVGLGNPGADYAKTRHNAGFWLLDALATTEFRFDKKFHGDVATTTIANQSVWLLKPLTYMNLSGQSIQALMNFYKIGLDEIIVAHDELDLPAGTVKFKQGGGHAGHKGLRDIIAKCGGKDFLRVRIGIDRPEHARDVKNHVLKSPSKADRTAIENGMYRAEKSLTTLLTDGLAKAMNELHSE